MFLEDHPTTSSRPFDRGRDMNDDVELAAPDPKAAKKAKMMGAVLVASAVIAAPFIANREAHHEAVENASYGNVAAKIHSNQLEYEVQSAAAHGENPAEAISAP